MMVQPCKDCGSSVIRTFHIDLIDDVNADTFVVRCCTCKAEVHGHTLSEAVSRWNARQSMFEAAMLETMRRLDERTMMYSSTVPITVEEVEKLLKEPPLLPVEFEVKTMNIPRDKLHRYDRLEPLFGGRLALMKFVEQSAQIEENKMEEEL